MKKRKLKKETFVQSVIILMISQICNKLLGLVYKLYLTNTRQINCIENSLEHINNAINLIDISTLDLVSFEIKSAWAFLGEITGNSNNEDIIDKIFSKFCLGK